MAESARVGRRVFFRTGLADIFYRKNAKELKRALSKRDESAGARFVSHHPKYRGRGSADVFDAVVALSDALLVIAREHGFASWSEFKKAVEEAAKEPELGPSERLFQAVRSGDVGAVRESCARHPGLAALPDSKGAFLHAWSERHREVARLLLDRGVACTLHEACVLSHLPTVKRLLAEAPALKDQANEQGLTPLDIATRKADVPLARVLLDARAQVLVSAAPQQQKNLGRSVYRNCSFATSQFHDCSLQDVVLSNINLAGATLDNVNLSGATIDNAFIRGLTIYGIEVEPLLRKELEKRAAKRKKTAEAHKALRWP